MEKQLIDKDNWMPVFAELCDFLIANKKKEFYELVNTMLRDNIDLQMKLEEANGKKSDDKKFITT